MSELWPRRGSGRHSNRARDRRGASVLLVASDRDWFVTSLRSVLQSHGFTVEAVRSTDALITAATRERPDAVLLDEHLSSLDLVSALAMLREGPLTVDVPLLVRTSAASDDERCARLLEVGAWSIVSDPLRPASLVAQLRRYLALGREMARDPGGHRHVDPETSLPTLAGLVPVVAKVVSLARRKGAPVTCTALGPTETGNGQLREEQRLRTAELCRTHLRRSDFVGWLDGVDLVIVSYGVFQGGAGGMARRLNGLIEPQSRRSELRYPLSAGILELQAPRGQEGREGRRAREGQASAQVSPELETLQALAAAQNALHEARSAGGGIRLVNGA